MKRFILSALLAAVTVSLTVQCATGNASEKSYGVEAATRDTTERNLVIKKSFSSVEVSTGVKLFYTVGTSNKVRIIGPEDQVENTVVTVEGGTLKVYIKPDYFSSSRKVNNITVYVTAPAFNSVKASSGSCVNLETGMSVSGDFTIGSNAGAIFNANKGLRCGTLNVKISSGAITEINGITAAKAFVGQSSGSILSMSGTITTLNVKISSGAIANLEGIKAQQGRVDASSGAIVNIGKCNLTVNSSSGAIVHRK